MSDRNLLVGALACQLELITADQLASTMQLWIKRRDTRLEDLLLETDVISSTAHAFLGRLVDQYAQLHNNDFSASLASLSSVTALLPDLAEIDDVELNDSITRIRHRRGKEETKGIKAEDGSVLLSNEPRERFRIIRPHAEGGLGEVSVGEDRELKREVAVKRIKPRFSGDAESLSRFVVEAEVTGQLEHPGIVPIYSLGQSTDGTPFYVMRFIQGQSLKGGIKQYHDAMNADAPTAQLRMLLRTLLQKLVDVCQAITYAHSRGILHRDLKPGNIMLGKYGETLVVDWGLARSYQHEQPNVPGNQDDPHGPANLYRRLNRNAARHGSRHTSIHESRAGGWAAE